jgi:hypothetical protein
MRCRARRLAWILISAFFRLSTTDPKTGQATTLAIAQAGFCNHAANLLLAPLNADATIAMSILGRWVSFPAISENRTASRCPPAPQICRLEK